jgi:predicted anti-sigma-YlaC factor YlaD
MRVCVVVDGEACQGAIVRESVEQAGPACSVTLCVGDCAAADREDPRPPGALRSVGGEGSPDPDERILRDVIGEFGAGDRGRVAPKIGVRETERGMEGNAIALPSGEKFGREGFHQVGRLAGTFERPSTTLAMECGEYRESLSARFDGEAPVVSDTAMAAHLAECSLCRSWEASLGRVESPAVPSRASEIATAQAMRSIRRLEAARGHALLTALRGASVAAAFGQMWMAVPGLTHGQGEGLTHHAARHMGSLGLAMGFAFALVAWQPRRAHSMMPLVGVLLASLVVTSAVDVQAGRTMMITEFAHLPEIIGSLAFAVITYATRRRAQRLLTA